MTYSPENNGFNTEFIVNKLAKRYDTVIIDYNSSFFRDEKNGQIDFLIKLVDNLVIDNLRIIINIPEDYPNPSLLANLINEVFAKYSNVKVLINNNNKLRRKKETEDKINILLKKYNFLFDKTLSSEEKISEYLKVKYNRNIPIDKIRYYLYQKILEGGTTYDSKE
jgi:cellulose biosynthesis protein BcsQ